MNTVPVPTDDDGRYGLHSLLTDVRFIPRASFETQLLRSAPGVSALRKPRTPLPALIALAGAALVVGALLFLLWRTILNLGH